MGKPLCKVGPTQVFSAKKLKQWKCNNGFFVIISCGPNDLQERPADTVDEIIEVFCDAP